MINAKPSSFVLLIVVIPLIVYFFFVQWQPTTIYGDDLIVYMKHSGLHGFAEKMSLPTTMGKYRPVHGLVLNVLIAAFQKNLAGYFLFNIGIQVLNTFLFAMVVNLFVSSAFYSLFISLTVGLSRFALYNVTQLFYGGPMEGVAMSFFLIFLYFIMRSQVKEGATPEWQRKTALLAILFANGAMYTHERYMMIFPFIILAILLFPGFRALTGRQKGELIVLAIASLAVNYFVKTRVYSLPYFLGTANAKMTFSVGDAIHFYFDAILSVIQINSGPEFLVGIRFPGLPAYQKILVVAMIGGLVYLLAAFIRKVRKRLFSNNRDRDSAVLVVSLVILLHLLLIPAVSTIRLEQRWIQGPFAVFVLILTILFRELPYKSGRREALFFGGLVLVYVVTDFTYLSRGAGNFAMIYSERTATSVKDAIDNGVIHADTHELYIWEKQRSENYEAGIDWELASGSFFEFYQNSPKKIYFVDSIYDSAYPGGFSSFGNFDKTSKQIVYLDKNVIDITGDYLRDSLKIFTTRTIGNIGAFTSAQYNARQITYRADDLDRYALRGIYENERGLRWTSGDASVQLLPAPTVKDSLLVELTAYMPEICKNIIPKVTIVTDSNNALQPISSGRKADKFIYRFNVERPAEIRAINILSDTLSGQFVKDRPLSFPLSSLDLIFLR